MKLPHQFLGFFLFSIPLFFLSCLDEEAIILADNTSIQIQCIEKSSEEYVSIELAEEVESDSMLQQVAPSIDNIENKVMYEDLANWAFLQLLAEKTSAEEIATILRECDINEDFNRVRQQVMSSNRYTNF